MILYLSIYVILHVDCAMKVAESEAANLFLVPGIGSFSSSPFPGWSSCRGCRLKKLPSKQLCQPRAVNRKSIFFKF